jgi:prevent-host-death family protein
MRVGKTGVREEKAHLSKLIRDVQRGKEWLITDRERPVARLVPATAKNLSLQERIRRLEDAGLLESVRHRERHLPAPLRIEKGLAQKWLQEDRGG